MFASSINAIDKDSVHRICSGQVVLTLAVAVKELVENSLDAGASSVEVKMKEFGSESIEVIDNGTGVEEVNFEGLTLKHHTSKIGSFEDVEGVQTFGFRGEALSSLCAMSKLVIITRHSSATIGTRLEFDSRGVIVSRTSCPRPVGTTVSVQQLFHSLPVRHKEFLRNSKKEFSRMLNLMTAYALVSTSVRLTCTNQTANGKKAVALLTNGNVSMQENIADIFGVKQLDTLIKFQNFLPTTEICEEFGIRNVQGDLPFRVEGYVSSCASSHGRSTTDRQYYYVNGRPCDLLKVSRIVNETYRTFNVQQYPCVVLNVIFDSGSVDVNVTPDKRLVLVEHEQLLLAVTKASLLRMYTAHAASVLCGSGERLLHLHPQAANGSSVSPPAKSQDVEVLPPAKRTLQALYKQLAKEGVKAKQHCLDDFLKKQPAVAYASPAAMQPSGDESVTSSQSGSSLWCCSSSPETVVSMTDACQLSLDNADACATSDTSDFSVYPTPCWGVDTKHSDSEPMAESSREDESGVSDMAFTLTSPSTSMLGLSLRNHASRSTARCLMALRHTEMEVVAASTSGFSVDCAPSPSDEFPASGSRKDAACALLQPDNAVEVELIDSVWPAGGSRPREKTVHFSLQELRSAFEASMTYTSSPSAQPANAVSFKARILPSENGRAEEELNAALGKERFRDMSVVGQFNLGFIVTRLQRDLFIIDQHASDEKYNFETLQKTTVLKRQKLVQPMPLNLTTANELVLMSNLEVFIQNGFEFAVDDSAAPTTRVRLSAQPVSKNWSFGKEDIDEMLFMLNDSPGRLCRPTRIRAMFASRACRKSVMIGTGLKESEMVKLIHHMAELDQPWNCPHGRPTIRHLINLDLLTECTN